jgi:hypothetical protein
MGALMPALAPPRRSRDHRYQTFRGDYHGSRAARDRRGQRSNHLYSCPHHALVRCGEQERRVAPHVSREFADKLRGNVATRAAREHDDALERLGAVDREGAAAGHEGNVWAVPERLADVGRQGVRMDVEGKLLTGHLSPPTKTERRIGRHDPRIQLDEAVLQSQLPHMPQPRGRGG